MQIFKSYAGKKKIAPVQTKKGNTKKWKNYLIGLAF